MEKVFPSGRTLIEVLDALQKKGMIEFNDSRDAVKTTSYGRNVAEDAIYGELTDGLLDTEDQPTP